MRKRWGAGAVLAMMMGIPGLTFAQEKKEPKFMPPQPRAQVASPLKRYDGCTVVFVANGAAGSTLISENLSEPGIRANGPWKVVLVPWCREGTPLLDYLDQEAQLNAATQLAGHIAALRQEAPNSRIVVIAHSAGTRVAVAAAEAAPEKSINRLILLGSGLSCGYDLRPALRATRGGIDSFFSTQDTVLDLVASEVGTLDGVKNTQCGGRVGFRPYRDPAYAGLRQYDWRQFENTHNFGFGPGLGLGDHFTWGWPGFLRRVVVPMSMTDVVTPSAK